MHARVDWREFEKLVARIERALGPEGISVTSPDRIKDKSGHLREVDAAIRYQLGSCAVLVTIECRDREHKEDVTWIEQLAQKRDSIGAATTVAVSSSGVSLNAVQAAKRRAIEVRLIEALAEEDARAWCGGRRKRGLGPVVVDDPDELASLLASQLQDGDLLVTQGAGNVGAIAKQLAAQGGRRG